MTRILLFGGNGQVGAALRPALAPLGQVIATTRSGALPDGSPCERADLADPASIGTLIARIAPDVVVNAAAYTAVDAAEDEPEAAFLANAAAPEAMARACAGLGARLLHYSTDYVFDGGATRAYREDDATAPLGVYGSSKLAGENAIRSSGAHHAILRVAWVYAPYGRNFLRTMLRVGAEREELRIVDDQCGTPTPAGWIAQATAAVLARFPPQSGLWHLAPSGRTSWYGFAQALLQGAHARGLLPRMPRLLPIASADYPTRAQRPAWSVLDGSRLQAQFGIASPPWESLLPAVLDRIDGSAS